MTTAYTPSPHHRPECVAAPFCTCERERIAALEAAARDALGASGFGVSEAEGLRRMQVLADLVGFKYDAGETPAPLAREDVAGAAREAHRLARALSAELEVPGAGWSFALFLFPSSTDEGAGHIIQVSRDQEKTLRAVCHWVRDALDARGIRTVKLEPRKVN